MFKFFNSFGVATKIITIASVVLVTVIAVNYAVFMKGYVHDIEDGLVNKAAGFTAVADEAKKHAARMFTEREDIDSIAAKAVEINNNGGDITKTAFFNAIPVVVGWTVAEDAASREGLSFKITTFESRNPENEPNTKNDPESGEFRAHMLRELTDKYKQGDEPTISRINEKTNTLHYMRAITLDETCMMCHGDPQQYDVPDDNGNIDGKDALGYTMENWDVGYMHGAYEVQMPLDTMDAQVAGFFRNGMMITVPLVVVSALGFVFLLRALLTRPIGNVVTMLRDIAEGDGDLTKRLNINRNDEIGQLGKWFDQFMGNLQDIICQVAGATHEVAGAATEIAASAEEMSASVGEVAQQAAQASDAAGESGRIAEEGGVVVGKTVDGMQEIDSAVTQSAASVGELGSRGQQIGEIIAVINDIADQTNLLALNAAIEAARAGEHGRGFAVVADEVRKLAERTTTATEEIADSIKAIQDETTTAVDRMNRGTEQVKVGVELAVQSGETLKKIVNGATEVAGMIQSISAASEQAGAGASQAADAATQLSAKAEQLQSLVGRFKVEA